MTIAPGSTPADSADDAAPVLVVGRTIGGILLVLVGIVLTIAGAFWYFILPWFSWTATGFWYLMGEWADLGGMAVGIIGILLLIVGGALVQRARKKRLQIFMDGEDLALLANSQDPAAGEKRTAEQPPTIL